MKNRRTKRQILNDFNRLIERQYIRGVFSKEYKNTLFKSLYEEFKKNTLTTRSYSQIKRSLKIQKDEGQMYRPVCNYVSPADRFITKRSCEMRVIRY